MGWSQKLPVPFRKLCAISIVVCLLATVCVPASVTAGSKQDSDAEIRRQVEQFKEKDLLRVKLRDNSEKRRCLRAAESDGLLLVAPAYHPFSPGGAEERVLYKDVASVKREQPHRPNFLRRVVLPFAALAGVVFATVKIGSNTPKTVAVKVEVGGAAGIIALQATDPRVPICP